MHVHCFSKGNEIINYSQLLCLCTKIYMHPYFSTKHSKPGAKKTDIDKTYANFVPFMTQQEEYCLNNQPTSGTPGFSKAIVDIIYLPKCKN